MINKKVTVIVPIYNSENHLEECIKSILFQSYNVLEVLLINDGSTDLSEKICKDYARKDDRIKYIYKNNSGVSSARNLGIKNSTGDYILFVDSDDMLHENMIEILLKEKQKSDSWIICEKLKFDKKINKVNIEKYEVNDYSEKSFIEIYKRRIFNPPFAKLYEAEIIKNNNITFDETLSLGEDLIFNINYIKYVRHIKLINCNLYYYRIGNDNSLSNKYMNNMFEIQDKLAKSFYNYFSKNIDRIIVKEEEMRFYFSIISNEFHNENLNIFKRYYNVCKIINKNEMIKEKIREYKMLRLINNIDYFLINNGLYIIYILKEKYLKNYRK